MSTTLGPVEWIAIAFPGDAITNEIVTALGDSRRGPGLIGTAARAAVIAAAQKARVLGA